MAGATTALQWRYKVPAAVQAVPATVWLVMHTCVCVTELYRTPGRGDGVLG